jgi:hypothetical protein
MMKKRHSLLSVLAVLVGIGINLPAQADPPSWAPAHGYRNKETREYRYVYYPERQVYYAPATQSWFWLNGGNWQVGVNLPRQFQVQSAGNGVPVVLHSSRPYVEHVYVEEHYGRPWREQRHHRDKDKHHKHKHKDKHKDKHGHHHDHDDD